MYLKKQTNNVKINKQTLFNIQTNNILKNKQGLNKQIVFEKQKNSI